MTVYNKLKVAILAIISSQHLYAITLDPLQIQSAPGELLYAEMSFHQADPTAKLDVGLATPEDLLMMGAAHQPPSGLNFYTRRNSQGEGVIVITSTRPMTDSELNIILKIQESGAAHLKHIKQPIGQSSRAISTKAAANEKTLSPKYIVSEKDIALNLPESTRFSSPIATNAKELNLKQENLLNVSSALPPILNSSQSKQSSPVAISVVTTPMSNQNQDTVTAKISPKIETNNINTTAPVKIESNPTPTITKQPIVQVSAQPVQTASQPPTPIEKESKPLDTEPVEPKEKIKKQQPTQNTQQVKKKVPATNSNSMTASNNSAQQHVVQRNESLWSIAQQIASQTQQPVAKVMNQIKAQNEHAFIGGNANRLRQGSRLNFNLNTTPSRQNTAINQIAAQTTHPRSGQAKYRLQQAEMSLVAESNQDSSNGSAKKDTLQQKTSADLSLKVMTAREKTVTLQRNVTQLELALRNKEQRIQLLNARLAELQDQLKVQQETKKPTR
ncbi:MAG: FimV domain-containing protein [Acinetobacter sp. 38-8]|nr:MAG: FimV domain-containing protein [Acinetobacter sp. 38-8]